MNSRILRISHKLQDYYVYASSIEGLDDVKKLMNGDNSAIQGVLDNFFKLEEDSGYDFGVKRTVMATWFMSLSKTLRNNISNVIIYPMINSRRFNQRARELMVNLLSILRINLEYNDGDSDFNIDGINIRGIGKVTKKIIEDVSKSIGVIIKKLKSKGLSSVLNGVNVIYVSSTLGRAYAHYVPSTDSISVSPRVSKLSKGMVEGVCHEFGHRYWHKIAKNKLEFLRGIRKSTVSIPLKYREMLWGWIKPVLINELVKAGKLDKKNKIMGVRSNFPPSIQEIQSNWTFYLKKRTGTSQVLSFLYSDPEAVYSEKTERLFIRPEDGDVDIEVKGGGDIDSPSEYGKTNPEESYAECFAYYVLGLKMDKKLEDLLKTTL